MKKIGLFFLFLIVLTECGQISDNSKNVTQIATKPDQQIDSGGFSLQQRIVLQKFLTLFQGVLNVTWTAILIVLEVFINNKWANAKSLVWLKKHIKPAVSGTIQVKMLVYTNGLIATTNGLVKVLNSMSVGLGVFITGIFLMFAFYLAYLKGQHTVNREAQFVERANAWTSLVSEMKRDRMGRNQELFKFFRSWQIGTEQEKAKIEEKMKDTRTISVIQFRKLREAKSKEDKEKMMLKYEKLFAKYMEEDYAGEIELDKSFCCDFGTVPEEAVVRYQNNIPDLFTEIHRLMSATTYFDEILKGESEMAADFEAMVLSRAQMEEILLGYVKDQKHKHGPCDSEKACPLVSKFIMERLEFSNYDKYNARQCCRRDPTAGAAAKCEFRGSNLAKVGQIVEGGPATCGPYCELTPSTVELYCNAIGMSSVVPASFWSIVFPFLMYFISALFALGIFYLNPTDWQIVLHQTPDDESEEQKPAI